MLTMEAHMRELLLDYIRSGPDADDRPTDERRKPLAREIGVRNMFIRHRLFAATRALEEAGASPVVLKGAHLIHAVYPFGIRPIEDIDLFLDKADYERVDRTLRALGYEARIEGMDLWTHLTFSNKITYMNRTEQPLIPIDIHFSLGPYPYLGKMNPALLAGRTETIATEEGTLRVLAPEALLLHLCLHLFQHHFDDWQVSCCDIVAVVRHAGNRLDWDEFAGLVRANRLSLPVSYSLRKARELSPGLELPPLWLHSDGMPATARERWVFARSLAQRTAFDRHVLQFLTTPGVGNKLRGALKIVVPSKTQLRLHHRGSYWRYLRDIVKTAVKS